LKQNGPTLVFSQFSSTNSLIQTLAPHSERIVDLVTQYLKTSNIRKIGFSEGFQTRFGTISELSSHCFSQCPAPPTTLDKTVGSTFPTFSPIFQLTFPTFSLLLGLFHSPSQVSPVLGVLSILNEVPHPSPSHFFLWPSEVYSFAQFPRKITSLLLSKDVGSAARLQHPCSIGGPPTFPAIELSSDNDQAQGPHDGPPASLIVPSGGHPVFRAHCITSGPDQFAPPELPGAPSVTTTSAGRLLRSCLGKGAEPANARPPLVPAVRQSIIPPSKSRRAIRSLSIRCSRQVSQTFTAAKQHM
jgi:hypothetical protein